MSGRLAGLVWESDLPRRLMPCAAVLAGFAKDDGSSVYPSMARLAWSLKRSERQTQSLVSELRALGVLHVVRPPAFNRPTVYRFDETALPQRPAFVARQLDLEFSTGVHRQFSVEGVQPDRTEGCGFASNTGSPPHPIRHSDPSSDPSLEEEPARNAPRLTYAEDDDENGASTGEVRVECGEPGHPAAVRGDPGRAETASGGALRRDRGAREGPVARSENPVDATTTPRGPVDPRSAPTHTTAADPPRQRDGRPDGSAVAGAAARSLAVDETRRPDRGHQQRSLGPLDVSPTQARASPQWLQLAATIRRALEKEKRQRHG